MRAYLPRRSTWQLVRAIEALDGVARVEIIAPNRGYIVTPARLRVTLETRSRGYHEGDPPSTIFTLPEARAWLASELGA